jgi:hypothetical protein
MTRNLLPTEISMKHVLTFALITLIAASISGCAVDSSAPPPGPSAPTPAARAALAELGIADVHFSDGAYVLADEAGREIGRISSSADAVVDTQLFGNRARTASTVDAMSIECNGLGLSLGSDAGALDGSQLAILAPCRDALRAADLVITGDAPAASGADDPALVDCSLDWILGCVDWNAESGCYLWSVCSVISCSDGHGSWYCTESHY